MPRPPRWLWRIGLALGWLALTLGAFALPSYDRDVASAAFDIPGPELTWVRDRHTILVYSWTPATKQLSRFQIMKTDADVDAAAAKIELEAMDKIADAHSTMEEEEMRKVAERIKDVASLTTAFTDRFRNFAAFRSAMAQLQHTVAGTDEKLDWVRANRAVVEKLRGSELVKITEQAAAAAGWPVTTFPCPKVRLQHAFAGWQPPLDAPSPPIWRISIWLLAALAPLAALPIVLGIRKERRWREQFVERMFARQSSTGEAVAPRTIVPPARQTRHPQPRWLLRAVSAALGIGLAIAAERAMYSKANYEWQIRPDRDWRVMLSNGCLAVGEFPPLAPAEAEVRRFYETIDTSQFPTISPTLRNRLRQMKRVELAQPRARMRAVAIVEQPGGAPIALLAGWLVALAAVPFIWPLLRGFHSLWVRRRRLVRELCPTCAYPLAGLPEPRCPECGERAVVTQVATDAASSHSGISHPD